MEWNKELKQANTALATVDQVLANMHTWREKTAADIGEYLRLEGEDLELDPEAIRATVTRPYTIVPINEHEAWLIHWRGVKLPIFGWVVAQEPAFLKARVTRSMDLLTPLPAWMKDELGWKPPAHAAIIDGTRTSLQLTEGDDATFKRRYGQHLGAKQADGSFMIKGGSAWIKLVAQLVKDGILPYAPTPVAPEHWGKAHVSPKLLELVRRQEEKAGDHFINRAVNEFHEKGAILVNYPPGAGKTLVAAVILDRFIGKVLILADSTMLLEQWRHRLPELVPYSQAEITLSTYQGAEKYAKEKWDLIIPDEAQRLPATTFSKLAFIQTQYRLGLTGTPWREDDRQHLIVALSGFPVAIRWANLVHAGVLRRPRILVATVANQAAKTAYVRSLLKQHRGRALIFCDWIQEGQALADALDVPFVHGSTPRKLQQVQENDVCVVSRIADRGISFSDLRLVIEVAYAGKAREQFAQRVGRLLHGDFEGLFVTVFTPEEAAKYRGRIFGVEAELAGEVDIEFVNVGTIAEAEPKTRIRPMKRKVSGAAQAATGSQSQKPLNEIDAALQLPGVMAKITLAQKGRSKLIGPYIERSLRYCCLWCNRQEKKPRAIGIVIGAER